MEGSNPPAMALAAGKSSAHERVMSPYTAPEKPVRVVSIMPSGSSVNQNTAYWKRLSEPYWRLRKERVSRYRSAYRPPAR